MNWKFAIGILFFLVFFVHGVNSQNGWTHGRLRISPNGHYLQFEDGQPFFWLGDTGWELFHRLTREEINHYLENRRQKGFTLIQAVILAEMDGLRKPNQYGEIPFLNMDPDLPNDKYFQLVDYTVELARKKNLFMGLLPTWGDKVTLLWGEGPVLFNEKNAFTYGRWLGLRYKDFPNIVWILGGDRPPVTDSADYKPVWRAMAAGIQEGSGGKAIITYHISGGNKTTSYYFKEEDWLAIQTMQSGHGSGHDVPVWEWIAHDFDLIPHKPVLDAEPNYEDHPVNPWPSWNPANGYFRDYDVRKQLYRSVFAGACGVTYGHHAVWQFYSPREKIINHADRYWTEAIDRPGAFQAGYLKQLMESRPMLNRVPDPNLVTKGQGTKGDYIAAFRDSLNRYAMFYLPAGRNIVVDASFFKSKKLAAWWFNPRTGKATRAGDMTASPLLNFTPPQTGAENDWVLVLDDASFSFSQPGKIN